MHPHDTIAAIATAVGGGIGIVRLSGPQAEPILAALVERWPKKAPTHKLHHGWARDPTTGERIDEVLACVMRAPHTFTGENVAELQGHGGRLVMERLLRAALACGARLAQPGEFTRRAFEAGRIDLTRAEAVAALIGARSERALRAAQAVHAGALENEVRTARTRIVTALAALEGAIDFPDESSGDAPPEEETGRLFARLSERLEQLARSYRKVVHEGAEVVLVGRVNAGKSSLFNALVGEERALVDEGAGTTRDAVEAEIELDGACVRLIDTAGERFSDDDGAGVERRGVELGRRRRGRADLIVLVVDGAVGFSDGERALWDGLGTTPRVIAWNKTDLGLPPAQVPRDALVVETSARSGHGIDSLRGAIVAALGGVDGESSVAVVSARHQEALRAAALALGGAATLLAERQPPELAAVEARAALNHLGRVTGETVDGDVLDAIFARFCIGK